MNIRARIISAFAVAAVATVSNAASASDASDAAREQKAPVTVVESVLKNIDVFFAAPDAPANRLTSGLLKDLALKAVKDRIGGLDDSGPGKVSESSSDEKNATYKVTVKTTRHETSEVNECVDNTVVATASESLPVVKDGVFTFDTAHPKVTTHSWTMSFCRTPVTGGGYSEWRLAAAAK